MHIQELLFEKAPQKLRQNVIRSNAQLQAMKNHMSTDWSVRSAMEAQASGKKALKIEM